MKYSRGKEKHCIKLKKKDVKFLIKKNNNVTHVKGYAAMSNDKR